MLYRGSNCVDFGVDQIDIKRKLLAVLGNDLLLQLNFGDKGDKNFSRSGTKDTELSVAVVSDREATVATL
jgi:hypothetical protein